MNKKYISMQLAVVIMIMLTVNLVAQDQALYFNGANQSAKFALPAQMPKDHESRTIEFWLKIEPDCPSVIIMSYGDLAPGQLFEIKASPSSSNPGMADLMLNDDGGITTPRIKVPVGKWQFVAITYDAAKKVTYNLNGGESTNESILSTTLSTTASTDFHIGKDASQSHFAIDNLAIWKGARTPQQIKDDMIMHYGNLDNLVAYFDFNEPANQLFTSKPPKLLPAGSQKTGINFSLVSLTLDGASRTQPISEDKILDKGIWYVIQNKHDVDTDTELPSRRLALKAADPAGTSTMASIPLVGDYDAFLWRIEGTETGNYQLYNKKYGTFLKGNLKLGSPGETWQLTLANQADYGTNAYELKHAGQNLQLGDAGALSREAPAANAINQTWLFQPMQLVAGYHIPGTAQAERPTTQKLKTSHGPAIYGSNTASDFAMLNVRLIVENMVNALNSSVKTTTLNGEARVYVITRHDNDDEKVVKYPLMTKDPNKTLSPAWIGSKRGGNHHSREYRLTLTSEEFMCKAGVYTTNNNPSWPIEINYLEFDHIIHEFGHQIAKLCEQKADTDTPLKGFDLTDRNECYAISVSAWFNSNLGYPFYVENREELKLNLGGANEQYEFIKKTFKERNTWMPPRNFRKAPVYQLYKGTTPITITAPYEIASSQTFNPSNPLLLSDFDNNYLMLDGNHLVSKSTIEENSFWGSSQLGIPKPVKSVEFKDGQLIFKNGAGKQVGKLGSSTPAPNSKLVLSSDNGHRSYPKVISEDGKTLWQPHLVLRGGSNEHYIMTDYIVPSGEYKPWYGNGTHFGTYNPGGSQTNSFWIRNTGVSELKVTGMKVINQTPANANANAFTITPDPQTPLTLIPKAGSFFKITFTPSIAVSYTAQVEIQYEITMDGTTVPNPDKYKFTFTINGNGVEDYDESSGWTVLDGTLSGGRVNALITDNAGNLYAGGTFQNAGEIQANNIAKWDKMTKKWQALGTGTNGAVNALTIGKDDALYAGGEFTQAGPNPAINVAKWENGQWTALGTSPNHEILSLAYDLSGNNLYAGMAQDGAILKYELNNPNWTNIPTYSKPRSKVDALAIDKDGKLYANIYTPPLDRLKGYFLGQWVNSKWDTLLYFDTGQLPNPYATPAGGYNSGRRFQRPMTEEPGFYGMRMSNNDMLYTSGHFYLDKSRNDINIAQWDKATWTELLGENKFFKQRRRWQLATEAVPDSRGFVYSFVSNNAGPLKPIVWNGVDWSFLPGAFPFEKDNFVTPIELAVDLNDNFYVAAATQQTQTFDATVTTIAKYRTRTPLRSYDIAGKNKDGSVWVTGRKMWNWNSYTNTWIGHSYSAPGTYAIRLDIDDLGNLWIVSNNNQLTKLKVSSGFKVEEDPSFVKRDGIMDVAIHTPGSIWALSTTLVTSPTGSGMTGLDSKKDFKILHYDGITKNWNDNVSGGGVAIAIQNDADGTPWVVTSDGSLYRYVALSNKWQRVQVLMGHLAMDITSSSKGNEMFVLDQTGHIYKISFGGTSWSTGEVLQHQGEQPTEGSKLARVTIDKKDYFWMVSPTGEVSKVGDLGGQMQWIVLKN